MSSYVYVHVCVCLQSKVKSKMCVFPGQLWDFLQAKGSKGRMRQAVYLQGLNRLQNIVRCTPD